MPSLPNNALRAGCGQIFTAAIAAAAPETVVRNHLRLERRTLTVAGKPHPLGAHRRLIVIGAGKASARMARGLVEVVGERIDVGRLVVPATLDASGAELERIALRAGTHPLPSERSAAATRWMLGALQRLSEDDLVLVLLSGGASALLAYPVEGISVAALGELNRILLRCGAPIEQINVVRRHLSRIKGGGLVRLSTPAQLIGLIISDVLGDPLHDIGAGPTCGDPSSFSEALEVLRRYRLLEATTREILLHLRRGAKGQCPETLSVHAPALARVQNQIVANNETAVYAAMRQAALLGLNPERTGPPIRGEARDIGRQLALTLRRAAEGREQVCLIGGGETTVTVVGSGKGGRNQELALAAALELEGQPGVVVAAVGTDGVDGPTDAAGAIVDGETIPRARARGFNPEQQLERNDAYPLLAACDALLHTGPTGTNVNDLVVMLAQR